MIDRYQHIAMENSGFIWLSYRFNFISFSYEATPFSGFQYDLSFQGLPIGVNLSRHFLLEVFFLCHVPSSLLDIEVLLHMHLSSIFFPVFYILEGEGGGGGGVLWFVK